MRRFTALLAAVAVFVTTYALILPAITLEKMASEEMPGMELEENGEEDADIDSFMIPNATGAAMTLTASVRTVSGSAITVSVDCGEDAGIPADARLDVQEITEGSATYTDYCSLIEEQGVDGDGTPMQFASICLLDLSILQNGTEIEPAAPVSVSMVLHDEQLSEDGYAIVHFYENTVERISATMLVEEGAVRNDRMLLKRSAPVKMDPEMQTRISFMADHFSAYAIVNEPYVIIPSNWEKIQTMEELAEKAADGLYIGTIGGFYLTNTTAIGTKDAKTTGIVKTVPAREYPSASASPYYFERVEGQDDQYYVYCLDAENQKQYVRNTGDANLYLTQDEELRTAFHVQVDNQARFRLNHGNRYWNMWNGVNGNHIAAWTEAADNNNYFYIWSGSFQDLYSLDGKTYGLMLWSDGTIGKALMHTTGDGTLDALPLTVMAKSGDNGDKLFVPDSSDITMWTFEWVNDDYYRMSAVIDGIRYYLKVDQGQISLVTGKQESSPVQVIPGTKENVGKLCLKYGGMTLVYGGIDAGFGFSTSGTPGSEWLTCVETSELSADYFMTYEAEKVSVSDTRVTNGTRIIVYTRVWNETTKKYEFYAVDHDGSLVRCFETGDLIEWVGRRLNSLLWNFVEYYWENPENPDERTPNYYYELYNEFSEKYIAPQVSDGQILSDDTIGINLNGRRDGRYYSRIIAWDDLNYSYVGLRADKESGHIISCPLSEADDFYFAIVHDIPADDTLGIVNTVDHTQYGITMRMVNFPERAAMTSFLGSDNGYKHGNTESGLLSTKLSENGYPDTKADTGGNPPNNLAAWFTGAGVKTVNHLFIESTYKESGYFEFNSVENFAHLDLVSNDFVVYNEIGTTDKQSGQFYTHGQFFPYNDLVAGHFSVQKNLTDSLGNPLPESDPRKYEQLYQIQNPTDPDYYLGMEVEAAFTQTPDGLDDWGHDIIYEFTGDDDFWLYVDGELIIDLGGVHDALPGSVNYRTGEVIVNKKTTTLKDLFYQNYLSRGHSAAEAEAYVNEIFVEKDGRWIFKDYTTHTMKIFYLERGAGASNLHMRFNLASIKPGTVELSKALGGVDHSETILAEFPYQILYKKQGDEQEYRLTNSLPHDAGYNTDYVTYKGTKTPVPFFKEITAGGISYSDVFMLNPDETAVISFPEEVASYRIVECGVNTDVYSEVAVNGQELSGVSGTGYPENRKDYSTSEASTAERARVVYTNTVNPDALRTMKIQKKVFREDGKTEIPVDEDDATFNFRLYMSTEYEDLHEARLHTYHVRDAAGNYCRWNPERQKFESLGKTDYGAVAPEEREAACFHTSNFGAISKIPNQYTVELRDVLAGTRFKVVERPAEIPDGYSFQKYVYSVEGYQGNTTDAAAGLEDMVMAKVDPTVTVCNLKGWGLRVYKKWNDADFMQNRADTYFAVFTGESEENLQLVPGTVRKLSYTGDTLYWYFLPLPVDVPFEQYQIREVTVSNPESEIGEDGTMIDPGEVLPIAEGGALNLAGRQKGETQENTFAYTVHYEVGSVTSGSNVKVDTVKNNRPGVLIKKQDWTGNALSGAAITLKDSNGNLIGVYTSDDDGIFAEAFFSEGVPYTLTETESPKHYLGLKEPLSLTSHQGNITIESGAADQGSFIQKQASDGENVIIIKNRPYRFAAVKRNLSSGWPIAGVKFALHKQYSVNGVIQISPTPMVGYEELISAADGTIPKIDHSLAPGTYELREVEPQEGYKKISGYIHFTISDTGYIELGSHPDQVTLKKSEAQNGEIAYTLEICNEQIVQAKVSFKKVDIANPQQSALKGAVFNLYPVELEDGVEKCKEEALYEGLISGTDGMLADSSGNMVFELPTGKYHLKETKAPENYDLKADPIVIVVTADAVSYDEGTALSAGNAGRTYDADTKVYTLKISNSMGVSLPSTGGNGTFRYYLLAGVLFLLAGVLIVMKKKLQVKQC